VDVRLRSSSTQHVAAIGVADWVPERAKDGTGATVTLSWLIGDYWPKSFNTALLVSGGSWNSEARP
jgi:hypothetical protein